MGEITDVLRKARLERERRAGRTGAAIPNFELPERTSAVAFREGAAGADPSIERKAKVVEISRSRRHSWVPRSVLVEPHGVATECFRHFAGQLRRALEQRNARTVAITSAVGQEGKTVVACNLALALASISGGRRIALVDLDLRRPGIAKAMGIAPEAGMEHVLSGEASLSAACVSTDLPALDLFLASEPQPEAHELLAAPIFSTSVRELAKRYDTVVCDTPPILLFPDVPLIMGHVDSCVIVARGGNTRRAVFRAAVETLTEKCVIGGFMNFARSAMQSQQHRYYAANDEIEGD